MTANQSNSVDSENSVFQPFEGGDGTSIYVQQIVDILELTDQTTETTTRQDIVEEIRISFTELNTVLDWLDSEGYIERRGTAPTEQVHLTSKGALLVGGLDGWR